VDLDLVRVEPRAAAIGAAVSNSFGFGGHNVALVFTAPA
jgi:3-oxoacyl-[acyl-carrier-protein] synthase II